MGLSTIEMFRRERAVKQELEESGQEDALVKGVRSRIQLVVDSAAGRRTFRNLWGLKPLRQQELFHWKDGDGLFFDSSVVGGKRLIIDSELGGAGESLVNQVIGEFGELSLVSQSDSRHKSGAIEERWVFKSAAGIEFHRLEYRVDRGGEFVSGFPATIAIAWDAVFPK